MRGTQRRLSDGKVNSGLTPAHAGNTRPTDRPKQLAWVHPRTCGEHLPVIGQLASRLGSPPHMRGTLHAGARRQAAPRFTPAHAGNTLAETAISSQHTKNFDSHTLQLLLQRNTADLQHRNTSSPKLTHSDQYTTTYIKRASTALIPRGRSPST